MKKAIIISYFFPPANSVASPRVQAFAENLKKFNIDPVIFTRHWNGNENEWTDFLKDNHHQPSVTENKMFTVYRLPYHANSKFEKNSTITKPLRKLYHFINPAIGKFNLEVNAYKCFYNFLNNHLAKNHYDVIIISAPPFNTVRLGHELAAKFNIPLVLDLRDIWQGLLVPENSTPDFKTKYFLYFNRRYARKWFASAKLITTVSEPLAQEIKSVTGKQAKVITNGFEEKFFSQLQPKHKNQLFNFTVVGTIYPKQDIQILIKGLKKFKALHSIEKMQLNFIGLKSLTEVAKNIEESLQDFKMLITGKIPRQEALQFLADAHILFYSGWKGHKGIYSTKIFEYLGARKNILIAPGDDDVIDELLDITKAGNVANSPDEFCNHLSNAYRQWETNGTITYFGIEKEILKYSRENQTEKFAKEILNAIS